MILELSHEDREYFEYGFFVRKNINSQQKANSGFAKNGTI